MWQGLYEGPLFSNVHFSQMSTFIFSHPTNTIQTYLHKRIFLRIYSGSDLITVNVHVEWKTIRNQLIKTMFLFDKLAHISSGHYICAKISIFCLPPEKVGETKSTKEDEILLISHDNSIEYSVKLLSFSITFRCYKPTYLVIASKGTRTSTFKT